LSGIYEHKPVNTERLQGCFEDDLDKCNCEWGDPVRCSSDPQGSVFVSDFSLTLPAAHVLSSCLVSSPLFLTLTPGLEIMTSVLWHVW